MPCKRHKTVRGNSLYAAGREKTFWYEIGQLKVITRTTFSGKTIVRHRTVDCPVYFGADGSAGVSVSSATAFWAATTSSYQDG